MTRLLAQTHKTLFAGVTLWLANGSAFAFADLLKPAPDDKSIEYLGRIFGIVPGVLYGDGGDLIATMFGVFNSVALTLAVFVLGYILIVSTMMTAAEGKFMGEKFNSMWVPLRAVFGLGALVPIKTASGLKGYCVMQALIMWIVVQGVGAADAVWATAVKYLEDKVPLISYQSTHSAIGGTAEQVLRNLVCMYAVADKAYGAVDKSTDIIDGSKFSAPYYNQPGLAFRPGVPFPQSIATNAGRDPKMYTIHFGDGCGSISWENPSAVRTAEGHAEQAAKGSDPVEAAKDQAVYDVRLQIANAQTQEIPHLVRSLAPVAYQIATRKKQYQWSVGIGNTQRIMRGDSCPRYVDERDCREVAVALPHNVLLPAIKRYDRVMESIKTRARSLEAQDTHKATKAKLALVKAQGWASAGSYYQSMGRIANITTDAERVDVQPEIKSRSLTTAGERWNFPTKVVSAVNDVVNDVSAYLEEDLGSMAPDPDIALANLPKPPGMDWGWPIGPKMREIYSSINGAYHSALDMLKKALSQPKTDPLLMIQSLGHQLLMLLAVIWSLVTLAGGALAFVVSICGNWTGLGYGAVTIANLVAPIFSSLWLLMSASAAAMAFLVPIIPFVLFLFGVLSWLMLVFEGMAAAPLVALGLIAPEGHDVVGQAKASLMMLVSLFMRPALMIFGLMGAMILSYVAIGMLNQGVWNILMELLTDIGSIPAGIASLGSLSVGNAAKSLSPLLEIIGIIVIYTSLVLILLPRVFSLIYELPNRVERWIGGQGGSDTSGEAMREVKSSHDSTASQMHGDAKRVSDASGSTGVSHGKDYKSANKPGIQVSDSSSSQNQPPDGGEPPTDNNNN